MSDRVLLESFLFNSIKDKEEKTSIQPRDVKRSLGTLTKLLNPTIKELLIKALSDVHQNEFERAMSCLANADKLMNLLCILKTGNAKEAYREMKNLGSLKNMLPNTFVNKVTNLAGKGNR